jgi:prevent-host-death family protein
LEISVSAAKAQLTELVRRAEAGDEIVLTRHGQAAVRLVPVLPAPDRAARRKLLDRLLSTPPGPAADGPDAARSQDFLYGPDGLPD